MRLGFSIKIYGSPGLAATAERGEPGPDVSVGLAQLRDILLYLRAQRITMYRMHCALAPRPRDADASEALAQLAACAPELAALATLAREGDVRLSFHPYSAVVLSALNEEQAARSLALLEVQAALLEALGQGAEGAVVVHGGGVYDDKAASLARFAQRYALLSARAQRYVALENDDHRFSWADVCTLHQRCGVRLVYDHLHHQVYNPGQLPPRAALAEALATWPPGVTPKVHFSTPRTEMRPLPGSARLKVPTWTEHSDFANPFEFLHLLDLAEGLPPFDVMLENKARDLALLKLREDIRRFAPQRAASLC
jgi:UV DNA damage endonuclease